jgi:hypothetical protein
MHKVVSDFTIGHHIKPIDRRVDHGAPGCNSSRHTWLGCLEQKSIKSEVEADGTNVSVLLRTLRDRTKFTAVFGAECNLRLPAVLINRDKLGERRKRSLVSRENRPTLVHRIEITTSVGDAYLVA